jgi:2-polyprenyl-6-methoxyphenol hydroxylase-like FAD-dependent oxidoreductase
VPADAVEKTSEREFVWIWYDTIAEDSPTFVETFTDIEGKKHFSTIPRGRIQPQVWQRVLGRKDTVSNPHFIDLLSHTSEPFVSAVRDFPGTKSIFHGGKILLVGDAFALCRPHAGGSTSQAAFQALELRKLLEGQMDFNEWERICVEAAAKESMKSLGAAQFFFSGEMPKFIQAMVAKGEQ